MNLSHKIALDPTVKQAQFLTRACGVARFSWNWALAEWNRAYKAGEKPTSYTLDKKWNSIKREQFPWSLEPPSSCGQQSILDLGGAFSKFFRKLNKRPKFKKKGKHDSFYVSNAELKLDGNMVRLPKLGWVRMRESLRFVGKIMGARVTRKAGRWFAAICVDVSEYKKPRTGDGLVGVDLGVLTAATLSTGEKVVGPRALNAGLFRLRKAQRALSRRENGSGRRERAKHRVARIHYRITNLRSDFLHKLTTRLCRENQAVGIEDLYVRGMLKNRRLARAISDAGFAEFRRQLTYKSAIYGTEIVVADRFFPSSKMCSQCGSIQNMSLSERTYRCACGLVEDRDVNAAINLKPTASLAGSYARGQEGSGGSSADAKPAWMNREPCRALSAQGG